MNEEERPIVEVVFAERAKGNSMLGTAEVLERMGYKTRKGSTRWQVSTVKSILANELVYRGMYKYGDMNWVQGVHEPILKEDEQ